MIFIANPWPAPRLQWQSKTRLVFQEDDRRIPARRRNQKPWRNVRRKIANLL
jgi:hypothetical protein